MADNETSSQHPCTLDEAMRQLSTLFILLFVTSLTSAKPNVVVVLADDLGYGDLSCYGHKVIQTPNLDRFAKEGLRFTSCYSAGANCSPSRAGLMTGRTPTRVGIHNWIPMQSPMHLRESEITIATLLQQAGYTTSHVGKWHLNGMFNLVGQPQPNDHGFHYWFSTQNNALPNHRNPYNFVENRIPMGPIKGYSADIVVDRANDWLRKKRDTKKPFFLFLCFHEPHEPIASAEKYSKLYPSKDPSYSAHHGNITQMDAAFGRLMKTLDDLKLREDTVVWFTSDNGPAITSIHPHGSAGPLREKKGYLYEGGIRVAGMIRWPSHIKPNQICDIPISGVDVLPTLCELAGIDVPKDRTLDGLSIAPLLKGKEFRRDKPLFWHFIRARGGPKVALRQGDWKLLAQLDKPTQGGGGDIDNAIQQVLKTAKLEKFELYNLKNDIAEKTNLAVKESRRLQTMLVTMKNIYAGVQRESPTWPAWKFAKYEGGRIEWPEYRKRRK